MYRIVLTVALLWAAVMVSNKPSACLSVTPSVSQEPAPQAVSLASSFTPGDVGRYNAKVQVTGSTRLPGASQAVRIDATLDLLIEHSVGQPSADGSLQVIISAKRASAVLAGQKVELTTDTFPNITALVDKNGDITRLFASDPTGVRLPGINYRNLILLFRPYAPTGDLKPGATWKKTVVLPPEPEKYDFSCTLQALEDVGGTRTARVRSDVNVVPPEGADYTAKGFALTNFSLDGGKLIRSHAEMVVRMTSPGTKTPTEKPASSTPDEVEAVVKIDIERAAAIQPPN